MSDTTIFMKLEASRADVGRLDFVLPERFTVKKTATGFILSLPVKISVPYSAPMLAAKTPPMLCGLELQLRLPGGDWGAETHFGVAHETGFHVGPLVEYLTAFAWRGSPAEMAFYENARNGRPPRVRIDLIAEYALIGATAPASRGRPERVTGSVTLEYSRDAWAEMLRQGSLGENVLVEAPLPTSPESAEWREVWAALAEARSAFEHGGETAWGNSLTAARKALEKWRAIEGTPFGAGLTVDHAELKKWTAKQRLDLIRFAILQFGHLSAHELGGHFKREHAQVALSTLAALLAERKP